MNEQSSDSFSADAERFSATPAGVTDRPVTVITGRFRNILHAWVWSAWFAIREGFAHSTWQLPRPVEWVRHLVVHRVLRPFVLPDVRLTVRVQSGLSAGLWIRARLPAESAYWRGARETTTEKAIVAVVGDGAVVYDVGAHIGTVALGTARLVGEAGRVVAFEADPDNVTSLRESIRQNGLESRVQVVQAAVWSSTRPAISFRRGSTRLSHGGVDEDGQTPVCADGPCITVPAITLDHFLRSGGPGPGLVKIDVEGGEVEVLRGGPNLFSSHRPRIIVEVHHSDAFRQICQWMEEVHYEGNWSVPEQGFPRVLVAWPVES